MAETRSASVMGGGPKKTRKKSSKHPDEIRVRKGKSGGYIATHHHHTKPGEDPIEPEEHVVPDMDQLQQHMADNMGDNDIPPQAPPQGAAPAPPPQLGGAAGM